MALHLRVLATFIPPFYMATWNSTGHVIEAWGVIPRVLDLIAKRFRLTYSYVPTGKQMLVDNSPTQQGIISYLMKGEGDVIATTMIRTLERHQHVDYTMPITFGSFGILIPSPSTSVNRNALTQPFKETVWMGIIASLVGITLIWLLFRLISKWTAPPQRSFDPYNRRIVTTRKKSSIVRDDHVTYILGVLLNQGGYCRNKRLAIRFIAGVWCFAAFVLVPAYSGNLISFMMSPLRNQVIESINDIVKVPGLKVAVQFGVALDIQINFWAKNIGNNGTRGRLALAFQKTLFRCNVLDECVDKVLKGSHVFLHADLFINQLIYDDFKKTNECRLSLAKETFDFGFAVWAVAKRSRYYDVLNGGLLEMESYGLLNYWRNYYVKKSVHCSNDHHLNLPARKRRFTLSEFSSTFFLLGITLGMAFIVFLIELSVVVLKRIIALSFY